MREKKPMKKNLKPTIPLGWSKSTIGEISKELIGGGTPSRNNPQYWGGSIPWLTVKDFPKSFEVFGSTEYITDEGLKNSASHIVPKGGIITAIRVGLGNTFLAAEDIAINQDLRGIIPDPEKVTALYLARYMNFIRDQIINDGSGSTVKGITLPKLKSYIVLIPPKPEQQKIAEILGAVDEDIEKTEEVIRETEKLKRGLMRDLLTKGIGHTKFKKTKLGEIPEKWQVEPLGKVLETIIDHRGLTPKKLGGDWADQGVPTISAMNVKNGFIVKSETIRFVNEDLYKKWMPEDVIKGDVILTSEAPLGQLYIIKENERFCLSQRLFGLRTKRDLLDSEFLYHLLNSEQGQERLQDRSSGSTAQGIRQAELVKVLIEIPSIPEQEEIARTLSAIDKKITINKQLKEKLITLKKVLMSDLLSGKVRTI